MFRIDDTPRNRNFLRLAALATVVFLVTVFGGSPAPDRTADASQTSAAVSDGEKPLEIRHQAINTQSAGSQNNQLSLMIFRSN